MVADRVAVLAIDANHEAVHLAPVPAQVTPLHVLAEVGRPGVRASSRADRLRWAVALGLAVAAHTAILAFLLRAPDDVMAGGGGEQIESISVTIVSSNVLESTVERAQPVAQAAAASVEATEGAPEGSPAPAAERHETRTEEKERPETEVKKPQEDPSVADEAIVEVPKEEPRRREQQSAAAAAAGGAAARADAAEPTPVSAPATASAGAVREFARYVSLAVSRSKPRGSGRHGTVKVRFVIAADGTLASADLARSSGDGRLDAMALEALRQAKFPVPPAGMTLAQLTYEVPYYFR
jgi:TonB family protein